MPLLEIRPTKKITVLCTLEESTALMVNQYAALAKASGDDVVNKALEYALGKDAEFQNYRTANVRRLLRCVSRSPPLLLHAHVAERSPPPAQRIEAKLCAARCCAGSATQSASHAKRRYAAATELVSLNICSGKRRNVLRTWN